MRGRSHAPRGRTPVVEVCHKRAGLGLISAVANRGELRWGTASPSFPPEDRFAMVLDKAITAPVLIRFLQRPIQDVRRKVILILDRLRVHRARQVRDWLAAHWARIEVFHLPPYSPELNPDEGLNADLKQVVTRKAPARSGQQLKQAVINHLRHLAKSPTRIQSYFRYKPVRYAA